MDGEGGMRDRWLGWTARMGGCLEGEGGGEWERRRGKRNRVGREETRQIGERK